MEDRHDLEPEGMREDTRHKIYTGSGGQDSIIPYVMFGGVVYCALRLDVEVLPHGVCPPKYPDPPLYSPRGGFLVGYKVGVLVGLQNTSPSRNTEEF